MSVGGDDDPSPATGPHRSRGRSLISGAFMAVVVAAAVVALYEQRHSFSKSLHRMGLWAMLASLALGVVGVLAQLGIWHGVLDGLGARIPWGESGRIYFVSQLGKYFPGSVWPAVLQMQAGRRRGINRRTMLGGNLITLVISCATGLMVGVVLLTCYDRAALGRYWWGLLALPFLIGLLHPRSMPALLDRVFSVMGREPLGDRLGARSELKAAGWCLISWLGLGVQLVPLVAAEGHSGVSTTLLCIGAMSLAFPLGVLFIPAPAGAGVREVVLALVLSTVLTTGQALAVVIASRVVLIVSDLLLAAVAAAWPRRSAAFDYPSRTT